MVKFFELHRHVDTGGVSGTGTVAVGVQFTKSGRCLLAWLSKYESAVLYGNIADLEAVHCHAGNSVLKWVDFPSVDFSTPEAAEGIGAARKLLSRVEADISEEATLVDWGAVAR